MRGKAVELAFDPEAFESNRTYVFAFGEAIVDLHEFNPVSNLKWAFATGAELDTLRVAGNVTDRMRRAGKRIAGDAVPNAHRAGLHLAGRRPTHWPNDASGNLWLPQPGNFVGIALEDENGNYRWDEGEYGVGYHGLLQVIRPYSGWAMPQKAEPRVEFRLVELIPPAWRG